MSKVDSAHSRKKGPPARVPAQDNSPDPPRPLIVGIGASAGGLEAFKTFFTHMPADSEMAFVLVQHLAPDHQSMLAELLGRDTAMTVSEAEDGERVQARHVYVIPPDATLTIAAGVLQVAKPAPPRQHRWPINAFFSSLAQDQGAAAVCVVLSGSGSDGAHGVCAIKECGGLVLAQAGFDHVAMSGMPASAEATGLVDEVLPVEDMPQRLLAHYKLLQSAQPRLDDDGVRLDLGSQLQHICAVLHAEAGHDFSGYKEKTLMRRIQRRMHVMQTETPAEYLALLRRNAGECRALFHEMLIGVTQFFRDAAVFEALQTQVLPSFLEGKGADDTLRAWVVGCATGEEAYSLAIALRESIGEVRRTPKLMVFATDLDERAISIARAGRYRVPLDGVSPERLARWFTREGDDYVVSRSIREMCVFSPHNAIKDPPFSRLDLITCRNLMIYFKPELQQRLIRMFHYALRGGGILMLGSSEGISQSAQLFTQLDKKHRLFARRSDVAPEFPIVSTRKEAERPSYRAAPPLFGTTESSMDRSARRALEKYSPAYVVVDEHHDILRFGGDTGRYLGPSSGAASLNLFALVHRGLRGATRNVVKRAFASNATASEITAMLDSHQQLQVIAEPLSDAGTPGRLCAVAFVEIPQPAPASEGGSSGTRALEQELEAARAQLLAAQEQHETLDEEMKSANEEYQSVNEELQSSNEELETSKEEMQSINEELQTVNTELQVKNTTLASLNSDLRNLMESTQVATLFLDDDLRIRSYTPAITDVFRLRESDRGRPVTEISARVHYPQLSEDVTQVLRSLGTVERSLRSDADSSSVYLLRMRPYRTVDNVIDGVVLTFVDITERERVQAERESLAAIVDASRDAVIGYSEDQRISSWNPAAERLFGYTAAQAIGQPLTMLLPNATQIQDLLDVRSQPRHVMEVEMRWRCRDGSRIEVTVTGSFVREPAGAADSGALIVRDSTQRLLSERHLELMLGELNHRVKNTLASVQAIAQQTLTHSKSPEEFRKTFMERLLSLSNTHNLLAKDVWRGAQLRDLVHAELAPYQVGKHVRVQIEGEALELVPKTALALCMAVHELATNAGKYGALSVPTGHVLVTWQMHMQQGGRWLHLDWSERDGPPVSPPEKFSFGHRLITHGLPLELDCEVDLQFQPSGVKCHLQIPLPDARADTGT